LNPTRKTINMVGGEEKKGKKTLFLDDIYPMYQACKDSKDGDSLVNFVYIYLFYWTILLFIVWSGIASFYE
jgi:hypothetical protein